MKQYDPTNWYWIVAGSTTQVYSSLTQDYVSVNNVNYVAWRNDGTMTFPENVVDEAALGRVLGQYPLLRPTLPGVLVGWLDERVRQVVDNPLYKILLDVYIELLHPTPNEAQVRARIRSMF